MMRAFTFSCRRLGYTTSTPPLTFILHMEVNSLDDFPQKDNSRLLYLRYDPLHVCAADPNPPYFVPFAFCVPLVFPLRSSHCSFCDVKAFAYASEVSAARWDWVHIRALGWQMEFPR